MERPSQPLDRENRTFFAARLGRDFSAVRVHTDPVSAASARALGALAYTIGPHIVFDEGAYQPRTPDGAALLAHELVHVAQQHTPISRGTRLAVADDNGPAESEARSVTASLARGESRSVTHRVSGTIQCQRRDLIHDPMIESFLEGSGFRPGDPGAPSAGQIKHSLSVPAQLGVLFGMTPWELAHVPRGRVTRTAGFDPVGPDFPDYARARLVALDTFQQLGVTTDPDARAPGIVGVAPTPAQLRLLDAQLTSILGSGGVRAMVAAGRIPMQGNPPRPSIAGHARLTTDPAQFRLKFYEHNKWFAARVPVNDSTVVATLQQAWPAAGYSASSRITPQEPLLALWLSPPPAGFYNPPDDTLYLAPGITLTGDADVARHEMVHLLGGREATLSAFTRHFGADWLDYWNAFEEGIAETISRATRPPGTAPSRGTTTSHTTTGPRGSTTVTATTQGAYEAEVTWIRRIINAAPGNRTLLFNAYFSGRIPEAVFQLLGDVARFGRPPHH
jgi:hypothetical protein